MAFFTLSALSVVVIFMGWCKIRPPFRAGDRALSMLQHGMESAAG
jgi:hypothetical protein